MKYLEVFTSGYKETSYGPVSQQFIRATPSLYIIYMTVLAREIKSACIIAHYTKIINFNGVTGLLYKNVCVSK